MNAGLVVRILGLEDMAGFGLESDVRSRLDVPGERDLFVFLLLGYLVGLRHVDARAERDGQVLLAVLSQNVELTIEAREKQLVDLAAVGVVAHSSFALRCTWVRNLGLLSELSRLEQVACVCQAVDELILAHSTLLDQVVVQKVDLDCRSISLNFRQLEDRWLVRAGVVLLSLDRDFLQVPQPSLLLLEFVKQLNSVPVDRVAHLHQEVRLVNSHALSHHRRRLSVRGAAGLLAISGQQSLMQGACVAPKPVVEGTCVQLVQWRVPVALLFSQLGQRRKEDRPLAQVLPCLVLQIPFRSVCAQMRLSGDHVLAIGVRLVKRTGCVEPVSSSCSVLVPPELDRLLPVPLPARPYLLLLH